MVPRPERDDWLACRDPEVARSFLALPSAKLMDTEPAPIERWREPWPGWNPEAVHSRKRAIGQPIDFKHHVPSVRQQYTGNMAWPERELLRKDPAEAQRAAEAVERIDAQMSKNRCE